MNVYKMLDEYLVGEYIRDGVEKYKSLELVDGFYFEFENSNIYLILTCGNQTKEYKYDLFSPIEFVDRPANSLKSFLDDQLIGKFFDLTGNDDIIEIEKIVLSSNIQALFHQAGSRIRGIPMKKHDPEKDMLLTLYYSFTTPNQSMTMNLNSEIDVF